MRADHPHARALQEVEVVAPADLGVDEAAGALLHVLGVGSEERPLVEAAHAGGVNLHGVAAGA